jgi:hypothetical protein
LTFAWLQVKNVRVKSRLPRILLAVLVLSLTPQTHLNPPDQSWLAGVYDGDDHDGLVLMLLSDAAAVDFVARGEGDPHLITVASARLSHEHPRSPPPTAASPPRAPPTA